MNRQTTTDSQTALFNTVYNHLYNNVPNIQLPRRRRVQIADTQHSSVTIFFAAILTIVIMYHIINILLKLRSINKSWTDDNRL